MAAQKIIDDTGCFKGPGNLKMNNVGQSKCGDCGSSDLFETREGLVCRGCGLVLEELVLEYHRPYKEECVQHGILSGTTIGFKRERLRMSSSARMERLSKRNFIATVSSGEEVKTRAKNEIKRILAALDLPKSLVGSIMNEFTEIRSKLNPRTKYRSWEKLAPLVIYFHFKFNGLPISQEALLNASSISKKDFNSFKMDINLYLPKYASRNRQVYIIKKILGVKEHYGLPQDFYYTSKAILYKLWDQIKATTDDVIVGLTTSITLLCCYREVTSVNEVCRHVGIKMSTIQAQVKKKLFDHFRVKGFKSLVRSAELLKLIMTKLGILKPEGSLEMAHECQEEVIEVESIPEIIEIKFTPDLTRAINRTWPTHDNNIDIESSLPEIQETQEVLADSHLLVIKTPRKPITFIHLRVKRIESEGELREVMKQYNNNEFEVSCLNYPRLKSS